MGTTAVTLLSDSIIGSSSLKGTGLDSESQDPENWSIHELKGWLRERDIHFEAHELRNDLVKRVQEAMKATERREHTEFAAETSSTAETRGLNEEIEMEDLKARKGKTKAAVQGST